MALLKFDFAKNDSLSAIWEIKENEEALLEMCCLTEYDKELLKDISSTQRRIEILTVRTLLNFLNPNITITYDDRKPICNYGFISISHSDTLVAVIWHPTKKPTVDIEHINDRIIRISKRAFNDTELEFAKDNTELLTKIWSCKECVYKLADTPGIDFKKQIFVDEFVEKIKCSLKLENEDKLYNLSHQTLNEHALIWGIE